MLPSGKVYRVSIFIVVALILRGRAGPVQGAVLVVGTSSGSASAWCSTASFTSRKAWLAGSRTWTARGRDAPDTTPTDGLR